MMTEAKTDRVKALEAVRGELKRELMINRSRLDQWPEEDRGSSAYTYLEGVAAGHSHAISIINFLLEYDH